MLGGLTQCHRGFSAWLAAGWKPETAHDLSHYTLPGFPSCSLALFLPQQNWEVATTSSVEPFLLSVQIWASQNPLGAFPLKQGSWNVVLEHACHFPLQ